MRTGFIEVLCYYRLKRAKHLAAVQYFDMSYILFGLLVGLMALRYVNPDNTYLKKSLPPLEFKYSQIAIQEDIREMDAENLPYGLDGS